MQIKHNFYCIKNKKSDNTQQNERSFIFIQRYQKAWENVIKYY